MYRTSVYNCAKKGEAPSHLAVIAVPIGEMTERGIDFRSVLDAGDILPKKPRGAESGSLEGASQKARSRPDAVSWLREELCNGHS